MNADPQAVDRREAVRRAVLLVGGSLSAPGIVAALARGAVAQGGGKGTTWAPRALTAEQLEQVATIAEYIIPTTDTPGARAAGVHRFVDTMLVEYYTKAEREHFLAGLGELDARSRRDCRRAFLGCSAAQQRRLLEQLDRETFEDRAPAVAATEASKETERGGGGIPTSGRPDPSARGPVVLPFFRTMKELTIVGYYTSQLGATKELRYAQVPGRFEGCVPLAKIGRSWAT